VSFLYVWWDARARVSLFICTREYVTDRTRIADNPCMYFLFFLARLKLKNESNDRVVCACAVVFVRVLVCVYIQYRYKYLYVHVCLYTCVRAQK